MTNYIPYRQSLKRILGSITAAILWERLYFRFRKNPDGFWKFLQPCTHRLYKEGDSWIEELEFGASQFRTAFSKIGIAYKSKTAFNEVENPFIKDGIEYAFASFIDRKAGLTHYISNDSFVKETIEQLKNLKKKNSKPKMVPKSESKPDQEPQYPIEPEEPEQYSFDPDEPEQYPIEPEPEPNWIAEQEWTSGIDWIPKKPDTNVDEASDFINFADLNWPAPLEPNSENVKILRKLKSTGEARLVLRIFEETTRKNGIKKSATGLLATLVKKQLEVGLSSETIGFNGNCRFCNDTGYIVFQKRDGNFTQPTKCNHDEKAKNFVKQNENLGFKLIIQDDSFLTPDTCREDAILTAKYGYRDYEEQSIEGCPYCNSDGKLELLLESNDYITKPCKHEKLEYMWRENEIRVMEILSAKEGYRKLPEKKDFLTPGEILKKLNFLNDPNNPNNLK